MSIRHPIIREHPIDIIDPFRDSGFGFRDPGFRDNMWREAFRDPWPTTRDLPGHTWRDSSYNRDLVPRDFYNGVASSSSRDHAGALVPASPALPSGALPLSRSFFNPERQLSVMDNEMARMATEMRKMFSDMQHLMPADADPDSWRIKENFLLENPFIHDNDGNRMFRLKFDVRQFRPEEIFVKTMGNELVVHAKHEEKGKDKSLHREYKRLYVLPKELSAENLVSKLSRDGVLNIEAKLPSKDGNRDRLIPIKHE